MERNTLFRNISTTCEHAAPPKNECVVGKPKFTSGLVSEGRRQSWSKSPAFEDSQTTRCRKEETQARHGEIFPLIKYVFEANQSAGIPLEYWGSLPSPETSKNISFYPQITAPISWQASHWLRKTSYNLQIPCTPGETFSWAPLRNLDRDKALPLQ